MGGGLAESPTVLTRILDSGLFGFSSLRIPEAVSERFGPGRMGLPPESHVVLTEERPGRALLPFPWVFFKAWFCLA